MCLLASCIRNFDRWDPAWNDSAQALRRARQQYITEGNTEQVAKTEQIIQQIAQVLAPKTSPVNQPVSATAITTPPVEQAPANLPPVEGLPTKTSTTEKTTLPNSTPNKQITNPK